MAQYMHSEKCRPHSNTIAPLRALIRLHARFEWTRECHSVFEELNRKISHKTMLVLYMPHPETELYVDHRPAGIASHSGLEWPIGGLGCLECDYLKSGPMWYLAHI